MERNESFTIEGLHAVNVRLAFAQLEIYTDDVQQIQVIASGDEHTVGELRMTVDDDGVLRIEQPQYGISLDVTHGHWMELCVRMPKEWDQPMRLNTISGLLCAKGLGGENVAIETISGDLKASNLTAGVISLKTTSGALHGKQLMTEKLTVRSVSGDVRLHDVSAKIYRFTSVSGDIDLEADAVFEEMDVRTVSGDCLVCAPLAELQVSVRSISGNKSLDHIKQTDDETAPSLRFISVSGDLKITGKQTA